MPEVLSESQIDSYRDTGYLVLEQHLPKTIIENIRTEYIPQPQPDTPIFIYDIQKGLKSSGYKSQT